MKILHTSDWHIGHTFFGYERYEEFERFFEWLKNTIAEQKVDILIVSGDIFDTYTPSQRSLELYFNFLSSIKDMLEKVVIIGGNHDSPKTLQAPKSILSRLDIEVVSGADDDYKKLIEFKGFDIVAISYLRESILNKISPDYATAIKQIYQDLKTQKPCIATGHFTVYGAENSQSEREIYIGKIDGVPSSVFEGFGYVAMGHLHRRQGIGENVVYSGSPLQMGFKDDYEKSVTIIDSAGFTQSVLKVPRFREFVELKGSFESVKESLSQIKSGSFVSIELNGVVDAVTLEELRKEDLNIVKIKLPYMEITQNSVEMEALGPKSFIEELFEDDEDLDEILKIIEELERED